MGLWSKGVSRSKTGKVRLEDGDIFRWIDEIHGEMERQWEGVCEYEHHVTPIGYMMIFRMYLLNESFVISFPINTQMSKIHVLTQVRLGLEDLIRKAPNQYIKSRLERIQFVNLIEKM